MASMTASQICAKPCLAARTSVRRPIRLTVCVQAQKSSSSNILETAQQAVKNASLPALIRPAVLTAVANVMMAMPAHAEAGKIFDFNLTLPIMAGQFLLLMVFLDKAWFGPVGRKLDERDAKMRELLGAVKDNSGDLAALQAEAEKILAAARQEAQKTIQDAKSATQAEEGKKLAATKEKIDKELAVALAALDKERADAIQGLDSQVVKLSGEILARVLPEGVKL